MTWTTLTLQVTTPLFNGGADPADERRASGPRARRACAPPRSAARCGSGSEPWPARSPARTCELLAALERRVFGGIARSSAHRQCSPPAAASGVRAPGAARTSSRRRSRQEGGSAICSASGPDAAGAGDLGCPAHASLRRTGQSSSSSSGSGMPRGTTPVGGRRGAALASLWLACAYGGLGARTRRGFGGVRIMAAEGPGHWTWVRYAQAPGCSTRDVASATGWPRWPDAVSS